MSTDGDSGIASPSIQNYSDDTFHTSPTKRPPGRPTGSGKPVLVKTSMTECDNCHEVCRKGIMFERHTIKTHPEDQKKCLCKFCSNTFFSMDELLKHIVDHWTVGSSCPLSDECNCSFLFKRRAAVLSHLLNKHQPIQNPIVESIKCIPKKSSKNKENPFTCEFCFKNFSKPCLLDRHIKIHTKEKPFECTICNRKFSQKNSLILHRLTHTNSLPHKCSKCPAAFNQFVNLKNHIKSLHPIEIPLNALNCPYCSCVFRYNHTLQLHIDKLHKKSEDQMINDTIIDVMNSLATLDQSATDIVGIDNNLFSSDDLDLLSEKNANMLVERDLLSNINMLDNNKLLIKKCHECPTCGKVFKKNCDLSRHVSIHENVKPFNCEFCGRSFRLTSQLARHKKNMHKDSLNEFSEKSDAKKDLNISNNCKNNNVLDSCISSLDLSPADISNQISFESREIFENVLNDDLGFNSIPIDSPNQNNFDADVSLLFNNTSLCADIGNENLNIEPNFIVLDTNFPAASTNHANSENNESQITQIFDQNKFLDHTLTSDVSENICNVNEEQDSLNNIINFSTNDIDFVIDNYTNIDLNVIKYDDNAEKNSLKSDANIPTISIPNSIVTHVDSTPVIFPEGPLVDVSEEITDVDILKFIHVNNFENVPEDIKRETKLKKRETMKTELAELKEVFKLKKMKYKDPPLANRCQICPASFAKPSDLVRHLRVHTRKKPYICKTCGDSFSVKSTLSTHERKHVAVQNRVKFMCQVCAKKFTSSSALSLHKTIHLEKRSHVCPICPATFRTSGHLDTHLICHLKNKCETSQISKSNIPKLSLLNDIDLQ